MEYSPNGNLTSKTGVGTFAYNAWGKVATIAQGTDSVSISYSHQGQRNKMEHYRNSSLLRTHYYSGLFERQVEAGGASHDLLYVTAESGIFAVHEKPNQGSTSWWYLHPDHLGSPTLITDNLGQQYEQHRYDAWGNRLTPQGRFSRSYTTHEHLDAFGLINMNGRIYDPMLGRMLSPDPYVVDGKYTQDFNRYSYARNNPLAYTDPDGEWIHLVIGGTIGGIVNLATNWKNIDGIWDGVTAFAVGAGAGVAVAATGGAGAGFWATAGVATGGGALTAGTNSVIEQTSKNFSGIGEVDWGQVGINSFVGGVSGFAGGAAGYGLTSSSSLVNGISSPLLRTSVVAPLAAGAGHVAGGTTANLIAGQNIGDAFTNSFKGMGPAMLMGWGIGVASTAGVCYFNGVNPLTGAPITKTPNTLDQNGILGTQKGIDAKIRDQYYDQMMKGEFDLNSRIGGFKNDGKYYVGDGHHRMSAASKYYQQTGSSYYIDHLINTGRWQQNAHQNYGLKIYKIK